MRADIAELKAGQSRIEERQDRADTDIKEIKTDMSDIKGQLVPLCTRGVWWGALPMLRSRAAPAGWRTPTLLTFPTMPTPAMCRPTNWESFRAIDLALRAVAKNVPGNQEQYIVIECTGTITRNDVTRAARNAEYMTRFTGKPAQAVVIGYSIPDAVAELARERAVHCIMVTNKSTRPR